MIFVKLILFFGKIEFMSNGIIPFHIQKPYH